MNTYFRQTLTPTKGILILLAFSGMSCALSEDLSTSTGAQLFQRYCASCHGKGGAGDGPVAPFFKLSPPDLTQMSRRNRGTFPVERARRIIDGRDSPAPHGVREMPVWGTEFAWAAGDRTAAKSTAESAIQRLVDHLQSIQVQEKR